MTTTAAPQRIKVPGKASKAGGVGKNRVGGVLASVAAWIIGLIFIAPVFFMVLTSFHPEAQASLNAPQLFAPLTLDGYREFFGSQTNQSPWPFIVNSLLCSVLSTLLVLVLAIPAAYSLSVKPVRSGRT